MFLLRFLQRQQRRLRLQRPPPVDPQEVARDVVILKPEVAGELLVVGVRAETVDAYARTRAEVVNVYTRLEAIGMGFNGAVMIARDTRGSNLYTTHQAHLQMTLRKVKASARFMSVLKKRSHCLRRLNSNLIASAMSSAVMRVSRSMFVTTLYWKLTLNSLSMALLAASAASRSSPRPGFVASMALQLTPAWPSTATDSRIQLQKGAI